MKTTIDIADSLLEETRRLAAKRGTTVKALVELGLRTVISNRDRAVPFRLRQVVFSGEGLHRDVVDGGWERIRDSIYEGRGGA